MPPWPGEPGEQEGEPYKLAFDPQVSGPPALLRGLMTGRKKKKEKKKTPSTTLSPNLS